MALTGAIVTAVVALFLLVEAAGLVGRAEPGGRGLALLAQSLGLGLATTLLMSSSRKISGGRLALAAAAAGILILLL